MSASADAESVPLRAAMLRIQLHLLHSISHPAVDVEW